MPKTEKQQKTDRAHNYCKSQSKQKDRKQTPRHIELHPSTLALSET